MEIQQSYLVTTELVMMLTGTSELIGGDMDQIARILEEAVSQMLRQFTGDGEIIIRHFEVDLFT